MAAAYRFAAFGALACGDNIVSNYAILCLKNDTDVAHYNFIAHQPILVIFDGDVAERACY